LALCRNPKAESAIILARSVTTETAVIRNGEKSRHSSKSWCQDSVLLASSGDKVPADFGVKSTNLQVGESALTGDPFRLKATDHSAPKTPGRANEHGPTLAVWLSGQR